jgi:hypothetical protein
VNEDEILDRIAIEHALDQLEPKHAVMMRLIFRYDMPEDWPFPWPPKYETIGIYVGRKYEAAPLSEAAIRYRRDAILAFWAGKRGPLRAGE